MRRVSGGAFAAGPRAAGEGGGLAEVVRGGTRREERKTAGSEPRKLSLTERQLYVTARKLLAAEIGASRRGDSPSADAWIGDQLARHTNGERAPEAEKAAPVEGPSSGLRARRRRL